MPEEEKTLIGDYGEALHGFPRITAILSMLAISLAMGIIIGLFVQLMLRAMNLLIGLVWDVVPHNEGVWWLPLVICPVGGLVIGLWNARFHAAPRSLGEVLGSVKKTGTYRVKRPFAASVVSFFLPLAFGGSIGPEAGLTGFIAGGATRLSAALRRAGLRVKSLSDITVSATISAVFGAPFAGLVAATESMPGEEPDERLFTYRKSVKVILYSLAAAGAFAGMWLASQVVGGGGGLPRFEPIDIPLGQVPWIIACIAAGYALALVFRLADKGSRTLASRLAGHEIAMGLIAGISLGVLGALLPYTLFSGEEQCREIAKLWQSIPVLVLIATAMVKVAVTPLCIEMGWRGGEIFPCIFSGAALGFGIASLVGTGGIFCATCTCAAFLGAKMRKPVLAAALLLLCFPPSSLIFMIAAAFAGSFIPLPKALREETA